MFIVTNLLRLCRMLFYIFIFSIFINSPCFGDAQILNDKVIGSNINVSTNLINTINDSRTDINLYKIDLYPKNGKYYGAVAYYLKKNNSFGDIAKIIDSLYLKNKNKNIVSEKFIIWRFDEKKTAIALSEDPPCETGNMETYITITYKPYE